jgi:hypothetical protein
VTEVAREGIDFTVAVQVRTDAPGYVVEVRKDERTAHLLATSREDGEELASAIRDLFRLGLGAWVVSD